MQIEEVETLEIPLIRSEEFIEHHPPLPIKIVENLIDEKIVIDSEFFSPRGGPFRAVVCDNLKRCYVTVDIKLIKISLLNCEKTNLTLNESSLGPFEFIDCTKCTLDLRAKIPYVSFESSNKCCCRQRVGGVAYRNILSHDNSIIIDGKRHVIPHHFFQPQTTAKIENDKLIYSFSPLPPLNNIVTIIDSRKRDEDF